MATQEKVCPKCGMNIPAAAKVCPHCQAAFEVKISGYCTNCHEMAAADEMGKCLRCGSPVVDAQVESRFAGSPGMISQLSVPSSPPLNPTSVQPSRPGSSIDKCLQAGERVLYRSRLHGTMVGSALFTLLIATTIFLFFWWLANQPYPKEMIPSLNRPISPSDTVRDIHPLGVYVMYAIAALIGLSGLRILITYFGSEVAITNQRLLGRIAAFMPRRVDIPLASIATVTSIRALLVNKGTIIIAYLPRRTLMIPNVPRPKDFEQCLRQAMPERPAALVPLGWKQPVMVFAIFLLLAAGLIFGAYYFMGGKAQLTPVAHADFNTIDQFEKESRVTIEGYIKLPSQTNCTENCMLYLHDPQNPENHLIIFVSRAASGADPAPGEMKSLPTSYQVSDLAVRLEDGSYAGNGAPVRLTGKVWETNLGQRCLVVTDVERGSLPAPTPTSLPVQVAFKDVCAQAGKEVIVEGQVPHVPFVMTCIRSRCHLSLTATGTGTPSLLVYIPIGTESNQMEELPKSYKKEDFIIHTTDGQIAGIGDPLILTGSINAAPNNYDSVMDCYMMVQKVEKGK